MRTFYDILEVAERASQETIAAAYRSLCKRYHPDTNGGSLDATERLKEINEAYETLGDASKRRRYDESLRSGSQSKNAQPPPLSRSKRSGVGFHWRRSIVIRLVFCALASLLNGIGLATVGVGNWYWDSLFGGMAFGLLWSSLLLFAVPPLLRFVWRFALARIADISRAARGKD